jgi:23S rRNA (guanosine2251-2'-O)-methyltransferase
MSRHSAEWIYGSHAVRSVLERDPTGVLEIWLEAGVSGPAARAAESASRNLGLSLKRVHKQTLQRHLGSVVHQGIAARYRPTLQKLEPDLESVLAAAKEAPLLLLLDEITDPHNLGACLRTADAAGVTAVVAPRRRAAGLTPAARKVASGAADSVPFIQVPNLAEAMTRISAAGVRILGAAAESPCSVYESDLTPPVALVLGSEDRGLRRLIRERCDALVRLPMAGVVESLNVAVAAGICLFESRRQQRGGGR